MNSSEAQDKSNAEIGSIVILTVKLYASSIVGCVYLFICFAFYLNTTSSALTVCCSTFFPNIHVCRLSRRETIHYLVLSNKKNTTKIPFNLCSSPGILRKKSCQHICEYAKQDKTKMPSHLILKHFFFVFGLKPDLVLA